MCRNADRSEHGHELERTNVAISVQIWKYVRT